MFTDSLPPLPHGLLRVTFLIVASLVSVPVLAAPTPRAAGPRRSVGPDPTADRKQVRVQRTSSAAAERGFYLREEAFVQDVYARLMRYDVAGRKLRRDEDGAPATPDDYLTVALQELHTRPAGDGALPSLKPPRGPIVRLQPRRWCWRDDPCHVFYDVAWGQESDPIETVPPRGPVVLVTTFQVTLTLAKRTQNYSAAVLFHDSGDGQTVEAEFLDPFIPGLQGAVAEESPAIVAPWSQYVRSARYAAIKRQILRRPTIEGAAPGARSGDSLLASTTRRRDSRPIGSIVGDDLTTADIRMAVMSTSTPCGGGEPALPVPSGEETIPMNWNGVTGIYQFNGQLQPSTVGFRGRRVREEEAGRGTDTCHVPGVSLPFHLTIGSPWPVGDNNIYGYDNVGLGATQIQAARQAGKVACLVEVTQTMWIEVEGGDWRQYKTNMIKVGFTSNGVFAERDGVRKERPF
jgi:hypothetical protein